jgi:hypothetical protein
MKRIRNDADMIRMINDIDHNNIDKDAIIKIYKAMYSEYITNISDFTIEEIRTYGVNYGTNYEDASALYFDCIEDDSYRTRTSIPLSYYILGSVYLSFDYICKFDYERDQIEVLLTNKHISDRSRAYLKLL